MKNQRDTVVGIFLDESQAQQAIKQLKNAGFTAKMENKGGLKAYKGLSDDERKLYENRASEGNVLVAVQNAGDRGEDAVGIMLQNLDYWREAPVWTVERIAEATADWFKHLSPGSAESVQ